ncbi:alanine--tRNA ligase [Candidatus Saccharibacteria bacterium]|nr:alanine--tRNA ligase [Candidatus Saccharibacteria bacterium]
MNTQDIRNAYLQYFEDRGHAVIPRALLMPQDDPTTLFTGSGMQPLVPYLLGQPHPRGMRLVDSQTCLRAQDIDEVGDNRHTTFFEMLGNWSLGDYFKEDQLPWFFEFLTEVVGLDPTKLYVTAFSGDSDYDLPKDEVSANLWKDMFAKKGITAEVVDIGSEANGYERGIQPGERIFYYDAKKNWWAPEGEPSNMSVGQPGGPDSEVFYEFDFIEHDTKWGAHCHPNCDCGRFMEIGNSVFMEYVKTETGFEKLPKQNVDFGGGLERIAAAQLNSPDVFKISLLWPIIEKLQALSGKNYDSHTESMRVIADHLRAATFLAVDGCVPSNKEAGYVMRRLLRRAIRFAFELGIEQNFLPEVVPVIADLYHADFPEVAERRDDVVKVLVKEEKAFRQTLRKGLKELSNMQQQNSGIFSGSDLFTLYDTYGFPVELSTETVLTTLENAKLSDDWRKEFEDKMKQQRERSQTAAKGAFKGGLAGHDDIHKKYHTATHLMYKALRMTLGDHVIQRGSNITDERLRFDFSHSEKMTPEEIKKVEDIVNEQIKKDLPMGWKEYPTAEAFEKGALGAFGDKYGDTVKVYSAGEGDSLFSFEICGGPHVEHTGQLSEGGKIFKITKEESSSAGIRRIKAVLA